MDPQPHYFRAVALKLEMAIRVQELLDDDGIGVESLPLANPPGRDKNTKDVHPLADLICEDVFGCAGVRVTQSSERPDFAQILIYRKHLEERSKAHDEALVDRIEACLMRHGAVDPRTLRQSQTL